MQFEYDPERLIEEVKKRPGIWDYENPDYRAKNMRCRLWTEIVRELMQGDIKVTKSEMRELEIQLQKKWKSIRDCFQKYVSHPNRTKRPYIYCKQLQFLLKDQQSLQKDSNSKDSTNLSSDSDEYAKPESKKRWRKKQNIKLVKDEEESSDEDSQSQGFDTQESFPDYGIEMETPPAKLPKLTKAPTPIDEFAFANVDAHIKEPEDPEKLFLLSLYPHLKSIPEEDRLNVKMDLMQVLRNANYNVMQHRII